MARKTCLRCKQERSTSSYIQVSSPFHIGGSLPICRQCLAEMIEEDQRTSRGSWNFVNKLCQWADIPFIPEEWEKVYKGNGAEGIGIYIAIFRNSEFSQFDWQDYNNCYLKLKEEGRVEDALPELNEEKYRQLKQKWGSHYDIEELEYLETLHQGILNSQNIVGAQQEDQVLKICKLSLIIEDKIRAGQDISKDLKGYDDLAKLANLTTKAVKDANDFSSLGELFAYLEKRGWKNDYYDDTTRDEIDFSIKDIKMWIRYLYVNETGIGEEIEQRIQNLKISDKISGNVFDEKEFRNYMNEQGNIDFEEEKFEVDIE